MGDTQFSARAGAARDVEDIRDGEINGSRADADRGLVDSLLVRIVEGEIIPRLMLAHRTKDEVMAPHLVAQTREPTAGEVEEFVRLALIQDQTVVDAYVRALLESGCGLDQVLLDLLAPAAKRLGEMWEEDECSFVDVTIGLGKLHNVLHHLGRRPRSRQQLRDPGKRALLATAPGEQHIFGILMVENFLLRAGWDVEGGIMTRDESELVKLVESQWFAVVGLSLSGEVFVDRLSSAIKAIRAHSINRDVKVFVGGNLFSQNPGLVDQVGADSVARDAYEATQLADKSLPEAPFIE